MFQKKIWVNMWTLKTEKKIKGDMLNFWLDAKDKKEK